MRKVTRTLMLTLNIKGRFNAFYIMLGLVRIIKNRIMKKNTEVKVGDTFKSYRPIHGEVMHKCVRIKEKSLGTDDYYEGWLVDENSIMIKPSEVIEVVR